MALPREVGLLADTYYRTAAEHATGAVNAAQQLWRSVPLDASLLAEGWPTIAGPLLDVVTEAQVGAGTLAGAYLEAQAGVQGARLAALPDPTKFATPTAIADYWLSYSVGQSLHAANTLGLPEVMARRVGLDILTRTVGAMVLDSGREAVQAGIVATPQMVGYYRKLQTPSCARCAVLAGAFYRWNAGFERHPRCDCQHVPAVEADDSMAFDPVKAIEDGQVTGLSQADTEAIVEHGADVSQVINAKRGLRVADVYGEHIQTTTESTTRRGRFYVANRVRLTPREIYRQAGEDRDLARRLLAKHGYVL